jgi:hypothetical protein
MSPALNLVAHRSHRRPSSCSATNTATPAEIAPASRFTLRPPSFTERRGAQGTNQTVVEESARGRPARWGHDPAPLSRRRPRDTGLRSGSASSRRARSIVPDELRELAGYGTLGRLSHISPCQFRAPGVERSELRKLLDALGADSSRSLPSSKAFEVAVQRPWALRTSGFHRGELLYWARPACLHDAPTAPRLSQCGTSNLGGCALLGSLAPRGYSRRAIVRDDHDRRGDRGVVAHVGDPIRDGVNPAGASIRPFRP